MKIKKTRSLIKLTCADVWAERYQLNSLQRKNWLVRKKLMQMEAPEDLVTSLDWKIEKLVRQERILDADIDRANDERQTLESECADVTKAISQMKNMLDDLHKHAVPLLCSGNQPRGIRNIVYSSWRANLMIQSIQWRETTKRLCLPFVMLHPMCKYYPLLPHDQKKDAYYEYAGLLNFLPAAQCRRQERMGVI
jgi:hypothetical protein